MMKGGACGLAANSTLTFCFGLITTTSGSDPLARILFMLALVISRAKIELR